MHRNLGYDWKQRLRAQAKTSSSERSHGRRAVGAAAVTGVGGRPPLLSLETIATVSAIHSSGPDQVRGAQAPYTLGLEAKSLLHPLLGVHASGHTGYAGSDGFADSHSGLTYG
ncbi:hypothetical protein [Nocardia arthritidis]|uniref:hypothetical protein n=1 Tax=Nocardia arthritidis TaxID=228602 RepID=UPI0007A3BB55|nr:hypothetical protein [Nocardia arthritidis]